MKEILEQLTQTEQESAQSIVEATQKAQVDLDVAAKHAKDHLAQLQDTLVKERESIIAETEKEISVEVQKIEQDARKDQDRLRATASAKEKELLQEISEILYTVQ